ncbi:MAG: Hpt domain-containing protein [Firmicutes bacterium]|nr:Hpt domain-containing protein [Bacillota bacterium]
MSKLNTYILNNAKDAAKDISSGGVGQMDYASLLPTLDVMDGLGRVLKNKNLYFRLLGKFSGAQMETDIATAVENGDYAKTREVAHALKGVCANLGLKSLTDIALQIEMRAKAEETAFDLIPVLSKAIADAEDAIARLLADEKV